MATKTYTSSLTAEECRDMVVKLLDLDATATDEEIEAAYQEEMGEDAEAQEPAAEEAATEPSEEQMPPKAGPKYKGSAMMVITAKRR